MKRWTSDVIPDGLTFLKVAHILKIVNVKYNILDSWGCITPYSHRFYNSFLYRASASRGRGMIRCGESKTRSVE